MYCSQCGNQAPSSAKFCKSCGSSLDDGGVATRQENTSSGKAVSLSVNNTPASIDNSPPLVSNKSPSRSAIAAGSKDFQEIERVLSQIDEPSGNFFVKLMRGDFGLPRTYWGYGFAAPFGINVLLSFLQPMLPEPILILLSFGGLGYMVMVWIGIWRASNKYPGSRVWSILAKFMVILQIIVVILLIGAVIAVPEIADAL